jgi:hypothetical protein
MVLFNPVILSPTATLFIVDVNVMNTVLDTDSCFFTRPYGQLLPNLFIL